MQKFERACMRVVRQEAEAEADRRRGCVEKLCPDHARAVALLAHWVRVW